MSDELPAIGRAFFLKVRCAYIRLLLAAQNGSEADAMDAVNVHDEMQVRLIGMTDPGFGDGTVTASIAALVAALPDEQAREVIARLCESSANYDNMVDDAADADASKVLAMTDEELNAEIEAGGGDTERLHRWGAATGKWVRMVCDKNREIAELKVELAAAKRFGDRGWCSPGAPCGQEGCNRCQ